MRHTKECLQATGLERGLWVCRLQKEKRKKGEGSLPKKGGPVQRVFMGFHGSGTRIVSLQINKEFLRGIADCSSTMRIFKASHGKLFQLKSLNFNILFLGGSESSWDKDKIQSPLAAPGPQHGIAHTALAGQPSLGNAPTLNPLQQNHLLSNRTYTILSKLYVGKVQSKTFQIP